MVWEAEGGGKEQQERRQWRRSGGAPAGSTFPQRSGEEVKQTGRRCDNNPAAPVRLSWASVSSRCVTPVCCCKEAEKESDPPPRVFSVATPPGTWVLILEPFSDAHWKSDVHCMATNGLTGLCGGCGPVVGVVSIEHLVLLLLHICLHSQPS